MTNIELYSLQEFPIEMAIDGILYLEEKNNDNWLALLNELYEKWQDHEKFEEFEIAIGI